MVDGRPIHFVSIRGIMHSDCIAPISKKVRPGGSSAHSGEEVLNTSLPLFPVLPRGAVNG
jgi:hypothetical protein